MCNDSMNVLYNNCNLNWPSQVCAFANVCGLINTAIWFLVFLPQIYRNFRHRTVQGLSPLWIISNFTASINNVFFAFKFGCLPIFVKISGVYSPIIQGILLIQIFLFTPHSRKKIIVSCLCLSIWLTFTFLQIFLDVYDWMQWITVFLWSIGSYPQVILNMSRRSTQGLSVVMVCLRTCSVIPWFFSMYLLTLPVQNIILCYFGGTGAFLLSLQLVYYWKQPPYVFQEIKTSKSLEEKMVTDDKSLQSRDDDEIRTKPLSTSCNIIRICFCVFFLFCLIGYVLALIWRLHTPIAVVAPIGILLVMIVFYFYFNTSCGRQIRKKANYLFAPKISTDMITVMK